MKRTFFIIVCFLIVFSSAARAFELKSPGFENGQDIPENFTCEGLNLAPELFWQDLPEGTQSLAFIVEDQDAPVLWTHWIVYDISTDAKSMDEALIAGAKQGKTSFDTIGYGGPCPPPDDESHRYIFKLYALDEDLLLETGLNRSELVNKIKPHIIEKAELTGFFDR